MNLFEHIHYPPHMEHMAERLIHLRLNDLEAFSLAYPVKPVSGEPVKPGEKNAAWVRRWEIKPCRHQQ